MSQNIRSMVVEIRRTNQFINNWQFMHKVVCRYYDNHMQKLMKKRIIWNINSAFQSSDDLWLKLFFFSFKILENINFSLILVCKVKLRIKTKATRLHSLIKTFFLRKSLFQIFYDILQYLPSFSNGFYEIFIIMLRYCREESFAASKLERKWQIFEKLNDSNKFQKKFYLIIC